MSLLLKALQRASRSREELAYEPDPALRAGSRVAADGGSVSVEPLSAARGRVPRAGRGGPGEDLSEALASAGADAALAREEGFASGEWIRENPVYAFAIAVVVFLLFYFAYVYIAINHPALLQRDALFSAAPPSPPVPAAAAPAEAQRPAADAPAPSASPPMPSLDVQPQAPDVAPPPAPPKDAPLAQTTETAPAAPTDRSDVPPPSSIAARRDPATVRSAPANATASAPPRANAAPRRQTPPAATTTPPAIPSRDPVQVRPTEAGARTGSQLDDAYAALQAGDLGRARILYGEVLARDDRNLDALLGAGTAAWRSGNTEKASDYFYRVLELEPQNAAAQAALIGMVGRVDPVASETRLKQLIAREPSGFLYAALGHVHAEQGQWSGAQQAYFQAFQTDPSNPDYAFNLAVGLERIGQPRIAASYYRQALDLARTRGPVGFDRRVATQRLERLGGAVE